jgi:hypothetical protein
MKRLEGVGGFEQQRCASTCWPLVSDVCRTCRLGEYERRGRSLIRTIPTAAGDCANKLAVIRQAAKPLINLVPTRFQQ